MKSKKSDTDNHFNIHILNMLTKQWLYNDYFRNNNLAKSKTKRIIFETQH